MPTIVPQRRCWSRQPQIAVAVNHNIPAPFTVLVPDGRQFRKATDYDPAGTYVGNSSGVISSGATVKFTRVSGDGWQSVTRSLAGNERTTYSLLVHFQPITTGATQTIFGVGGSLQVRLNASNQIELLQQGVALRGTSAQTYGDGRPHTVGVTCITGGSTRVFCDGLEVITYAGTIDIGPTDKTYTTLAKRNNVGEEFNGHIGLYAHWSGLELSSLVRELSANPWQIFAKRDRYAFVSLGGGSSIGLTISDSSHSHTADNLTLDTSNTTWLTVQEATHGHAADTLGLTLDTWLSIVEAAHAHYADAPTLTAETALQIAEVLHVTYADTLVLSLPGAPGSYPTAESIAAAVLAALQGTTIPVDARLMNGAPVVGDGSELNPWRGVGVSP